MNNQGPGNDEKHQERVNDVLNEILASYQMMVDNISDTHFQPIKDIIRGSTEQRVDLEKASKLFKANLIEKLQNEFQKCWEETEVDQKLMELEKSKEMAADGEKKWRPTKVDVEAQLRPRIARALIAKKKYLTMEVEHQSQVITDLLGQVEEQRDGLQARSEKRQQLLAAINKDIEKVNNVEQQINEMNATKFQKK